MRITKDMLLNIAQDTVTKRVQEDPSIMAAYLHGSILSEEPLLGGTTDRPTFFSARFVFGGFSNSSRSVRSSGLSGANSTLYFQPFSSNFDSISLTLFSDCTVTTAGFRSVPNFPAFFPSNIFFIFSPSVQ